ncbi:protein kinase domain protein [Ichthyophthirius multifiliis]|uniref:Protein kinase domain protein n=1 Tax=Ichthyophthirius multifiliis TaxID=5932 RepID=G0QSJ1_ICHMU|nr:protein kinase domain protein [Ichthyophthirius multifiliis]EGR31829.1 protein kinase domain protein [Ichthyophthirius multifiliis]|eukprot:XP_004035315.1 protein kinase domain protein [Ichthyophthirius multifiliis]
MLNFYLEIIKIVNQTQEIKEPIKWKAGKELGFGSFGRVIEGFNRLNGEIMAVKQINIQNSKNKTIKSIIKEVNILSEMKHNNIVRYIDIQQDINQQHISILLEYVVGGSLNDMINKYGSINENLVQKYTKDILQGLEYLHYHGVVHRDIKGANILVDNNGICKVADFGGAKKIIQQDTILSLAGTANWMGPEVIKQQNFGRYSDIWSLGCTVIEMLTGKPPFYNLGNAFATMFKIAQDNESPPLPNNVSDICKDFLQKCLNPNPLKRWNVYQLLRHEFISRDQEENGFNQEIQKNQEPNVKTL